jgi:hypothetical protein
MKTMTATWFKVHCLAVMDEVQAKRQAVVSPNAGSLWQSLCPPAKTLTISTVSFAARGRLQVMSCRQLSKTGAVSKWRVPDRG